MLREFSEARIADSLPYPTAVHKAGQEQCVLQVSTHSVLASVISPTLIFLSSPNSIPYSDDPTSSNLFSEQPLPNQI